MTNLFQSYRTTEHLQSTTQRVWFAEKDNHRRKGKLCVGHTKCYTKVTVPFEEGLLGTCALMEITECFRWHVEGVILQRNLGPAPVKAGYFDHARELLAHKKQNYQKKPKKMTDRTREKLKELVDLEEESEDELETQFEDSKSAESGQEDSEEPKMPGSGREGKRQPDELLGDSAFGLQMEVYKRATRMADSLSTVERVALACFFLGVLLHIFGC